MAIAEHEVLKADLAILGRGIAEDDVLDIVLFVVAEKVETIATDEERQFPAKGALV